MKIKYLLIGITFIGLSCSPTLKIKPLNEKTGKLPTDTRLTKNEIDADKPIDINKYKQFLFISGSRTSSGRYGDYIVETLKEIGGFEKYYTQPELEQFVIQNNLTDKVTSISDRIGLLKLQQQVGNFLLCETRLEYLGAYEYSFDFKIIDPSNSEILLEIRHKAFNWSGLDRPLFNPVFNYYIDWLKGETKQADVINPAMGNSKRI